MDEIKVLKNMVKVKAPPDFENRIYEVLDARKRKLRKVRTLRLSLAGAAGLVALVFLIFSMITVSHQSMPERATSEKAGASTFQGMRLSEPGVIPVIEQVTYGDEFQGRRQKTPTIYILEQVSDSPGTPVKY